MITSLAKYTRFFTKHSTQTRVSFDVLLFLAMVPVFAAIWQQPYYLSLFSRIMIFALAALGLNLVLGFGGMVSFGHALYVGVGAYAVGILSFHEITNGWVHLICALLAAGVIAACIGAVVLRTTGMSFIMITLAFAQMGYFLTVSLKQYGGDDGLPVAVRSALGVVDLNNNVVLYYFVFAALLLVLWGMSRLLNAPFGLVLRGIKSNERRVLALGYESFRYKLVAYVLSAMICALAGFCLANLTKFAAPSYLAWQVSGELIVICVLGGMAILCGPVVGAMSLLILEELLSNFQPGLWPAAEALLAKHWLGVIGLCIFVLALTAKRGMLGALSAGSKAANTP